METSGQRANATRTWALPAVVLLCALAPTGAARAQENAGGRPELTVWLMPNEPAKEVDAKADINAEVEQFNKELAGLSVVVLNTSDHDLRQQLLRWNPEFAVPEWRIIKGQRETLLALGGFAEKHKVAVRVLVVNWGQAFGELRRTLEQREEGMDRLHPDVVQVGSTWTAYFDSTERILSPTTEAQAGKLDWRRLQKSGLGTIRYIHDVRLLFYWKRLPDEPSTAEPFQMNSESWETIIHSLKEDVGSRKSGPPRPPMAMPTGAGPNLLHDYVPLIWAGGGTFLQAGSTRVDLTSDRAMKVPLLLTRKALFTDDRGTTHRLIAFPRMSHEEVLSPHFLLGRYRAVIEPVAFLRRWKKDFDQLKKTGSGKIPPDASFWDYCGVTVPPAPFKGGSDLMVIRGTTHPDLAFYLAAFLASDKACKRRLAEYGHLPAQDQANGFGVGQLLDYLGAEGAPRERIQAAVIRAVKEGQEYPQFEKFAPDVESPEVLETMQRLWRQISEAGGDEGEGAQNLQKAAENAELAINLRIDRRTQVGHFFRQYWPHITVGILVLVIGLLLKHRFNARRRFREEHEKNRLLEEIRTVRGFAASALQLVDSTHHNLSRKPDVLASATEKEKVKALMIRAGLRGWRRGSDDANWKRGGLEQVIWRAVVLSIDYLYDPRLFSEWESSGSPLPRAFLKEKGLIRENPAWADGDGPFCIVVKCSDADMVQMPLMLEHLLICLLTNAFKASRIQDELGEKPDYFKPVRIEYNRADALLVLSNEVGEGHPGLSPVLCEVLNGSRTVDEFESRIRDLLRGPVRHWPGIGLVEVYCMAKQCFGGLIVDATSPRVSLRLNGSCREKR